MTSLTKRGIRNLISVFSYSILNHIGIKTHDRRETFHYHFHNKMVFEQWQPCDIQDVPIQIQP